MWFTLLIQRVTAPKQESSISQASTSCFFALSKSRRSFLIRCVSRVELIDELTDICIRQAEIIRAQALTIEQFGAQALEDSEVAARLQQLVGNTDIAKRGA